jgi:dTDP-4-amino-4,6-dideoxygalactose transaminase
MSRDAWKRFGGEGYRHYQVIEPGYKYNMMDIQAALGLHQLARWRRNWEKRKSIWQRYQRALATLPVTRPQDPEPQARHSYHLYTLRVDESCAGVSRDGFLEAMTRQNIGVGVHYLSIPEHPYYQRAFGWRPEDYPHAMRIGRETVSLPLSPKVTARDVGDVVRAVRRSVDARLPTKRTGSETSARGS